MCRLASSDSIAQLLSVPSMSLSTAIDYAEVVRYMGAKDIKLLQSYEQSMNLTQNIGFTPEFLLQLKCAVILTGARFTFFRLRSKAEADVSSKRMERLCQILEVIRSYNILNCLLMQKREFSPFERLSGRCLRLSIQEYVATKPATDEFVKIYDVLTPELITLMQESAQFASGEPEVCSVCAKRLEMNSLKCEEDHFVVRCCISKVQITDLTPKMCLQCRRCVWNNLGALKKVVGDKEELLLCPLCDVSFEIT